MFKRVDLWESFENNDTAQKIKMPYIWMFNFKFWSKVTWYITYKEEIIKTEIRPQDNQ